MNIRCLLIAPLASGPGFSGEDAYTQTLLVHPPSGVQYIHYQTLLSSGEAWRRTWLSWVYWCVASMKVFSPETWIEFFMLILQKSAFL